MLETGFEKNNLSWQWELIQRRFGEWLLLKLKNSTIPGLPFSISPRVIEGIFWVITLCFFAWVVWRLIPLFEKSWFALNKTADSRLTQVLSTPSQDYTVAQWLKQAQQLHNRGEFTQACLAVYRAMLQRLHDTDIIRHDPSRTDDEYSQLTQALPNATPYQALLKTHENLCFGNAQGSNETYELCQQAYREIDPQ